MKTLLKPTFTATTFALTLSACNLAPKYEQPQIALPSNVFQYDAAQGQASFQVAQLGWQDYFADPRLHQLIELALKNNTDLRTAALNVEQIRAQYAITRATQLPSLGLEASAKRDGDSRGVGEGYNVGLGVAGFELDLWGRIRNSNQAALQSYFAVKANRDAAQLSLIASVAKAHFAEIQAQNTMQLAERVLASREKTHRLTELRHKAGVISAVQLHQQTALIEQAKTSYAAAVQAKIQARNALQLLISDKLPENLPQPLPLNQQFKITQLPAGLSSDLLLNRPDIIAAEHGLKEQNANIGAARAAFFPRISLTSSLGFGSNQLDNLFQSANKAWSFGGGLSLPIFDFGANSARLAAAKIGQQKALVAYEAAVESAFRDVSDALIARATLHRQYESDVIQSKATDETLRLTRLRHQHGIASALDLLDAERSSYAAASALLTTERTLADNLVDLYKVLGGGLKQYTQDASN